MDVQTLRATAEKRRARSMQGCLLRGCKRGCRGRRGWGTRGTSKRMGRGRDDAGCDTDERIQMDGPSADEQD